MGRKRGQYYVSPEDFKEEIRKYKEEDVITEYLGEMLIKLATRYATKPNFSGYSYKEEFVSDAVLRMVGQLHKIDLSHPKCNPFAYLTQTCKNCFKARINKEKKYFNTKEALKEKYFNEIESAESIHFKKNPDEEDIEDND